MKQFAFLAVSVFLVLTGSGCLANKTIETSTGTRIIKSDYNEKTETGKIIYKDEKGVTTQLENRGAGEGLPEGFPKEFPIMKGVTQVTANAMTDKDNRIYTVDWSTKSSVADVVSFYRDAFPKNGWTITSSHLSDGEATIVVTRGTTGSSTTTLTITPEDGVTRIGAWISEIKP